MEGNHMNRTDAKQDTFDLPTLWADLQDLEDGSLAPDKHEALIAMLNRSPAAQRSYFEYFHQAAILRMEAEKLRERSELTAVSPMIPFRPWWRQPWLAAAAVFLFAALIGVLVINQGGRSIPSRPDSLHASVFEGTLWEINGIPKTGSAQGVEVNRGDSVRVQSGTVKLELESGSIMVMQGPALASFPELRKPVVQEGWLWIDTGSTEDSFEVSTPELVVKDIGTRFGVRISESGHSEIHLLDGGVNVISQESGIKLATLAPDGTGRVITADGALNNLPLAEDPFPMLQSRLSGGTSYEKAILAQNPSGYWKFDRAIDGWFDNQVLGHRKVKSGPVVSIHPDGVNEDNRFNGFDASNKSLYFPANEHNDQYRSVLAFLDGGDGVSRQQGAMTFWIKQRKGANEDQVLWLAGMIAPDKGAPTNSLAHSYLTTSGHLVFSLASGEQNASVKSSQSIEQGEWHHIGISWNAAQVELYMDGKRVAQRSDVAALHEWVASGNFARFGKPTENLYRRQIRNFHGWLDEYALWNRPLTPEEVEQQFQAARGGDDD